MASNVTITIRVRRLRAVVAFMWLLERVVHWWSPRLALWLGIEATRFLRPEWKQGDEWRPLDIPIHRSLRLKGRA